MQRTLLVAMLLLRLLVVFQFANALPEAGGGLRGRSTVHDSNNSGRGNTLFHRRAESDSMPETLHTTLTTTTTTRSVVSTEHRISEIFPTQNGLQKLIVGGTNAGSTDFTREYDPSEVSLGQPQPRIINGNDVAPEARYPWFVRVLGNNAQNMIESCGASLIAPDVAITAAHCTVDRAMISPYNLDEIKVGEPGNMVRRDVVRLRRHPDYDPFDDSKMEVDFDIMMVKLEEPVLDVDPIMMNFDDNYPSVSGDTLHVIGFGSVLGGPNQSKVQPSVKLQEAPTDYVPFDECAVAEDPDTGIKYGISETQTVVREWWLCTLRVGTGTCYGDSGGPVIKKGANPENDLLLGVISGASGYCAQPYLPLHNNRVSSHQDWITKVGCEFSTMPPAYWNCPASPTTPPTTAPIAPTTPPTAAPIAPPTTPPTALPTASPTKSPTNFPTISAAPTESFAPTVTPTGPDYILYGAIGAGALAVVVAGTVGIWLIKRRKKRVDDIDQYSTTDDEKPSKHQRKKKAGKEPSTPSPDTSVESEAHENTDPKGKSKGFFSRFARNKSPEEEESSVESDLESHEMFDNNGESRRRLFRQRPSRDLQIGYDDDSSLDATSDRPDDDVEQYETPEDSANETEDFSNGKSRRSLFSSEEESGSDDVVYQNEQLQPDDSPPRDESNGRRRKRFFPSFFRRKDKTKNKEDSEATKLSKEPSPSDAISEPSVAQVSDPAIDNDGTTNTPIAGAGYVPPSTASMIVQVDVEADGIPYDTASIIVQPDKEFMTRDSSRRENNGFVFPRTNQLGTTGSPLKDRAKSSASKFHSAYSADDDIKAVVHRGRDNTPMRSHSLDRTRADDYASKQFDRIRPRSHSLERRNYNSRPRNTSRESPFASEFAQINNNQRPFAGEDNNRSRGRSRERSKANELTSGEGNPRNTDPPGEVYADRLRRPSSLERSDATSYATSGSTIEKYTRQRRRYSSLDNKSYATDFATTSGSVADKYTSPRRSSIDQPRANKFANNYSTGEQYRSPRRSSSLDRSSANNYANNYSTGGKYSRPKRSSSLDRSRANNYANNYSTGEIYTKPRRSSSIDRSRANNYANAKRVSPNTNSASSNQKRVSSPNATGQTNNGERVVDKGTAPAVVVTKNPDGSIVHEVKRRREDGALVTTKTKYANIRLARKYGVPV